MIVAISSEAIAEFVETARGRRPVGGGMWAELFVLMGAWLGFELCAASMSGVRPSLSFQSMVCGNVRQSKSTQSGWEWAAARWRAVDPSTLRLMPGAES